MRRLLFLLVGGLVLVGGLSAGEKDSRPDILFADFEGEDYGDWKVTGTAFGTRPARGTLPNQMPVSGYKGKGLVNSYHGGDDSTGTLTSPEFTINRRFLSFLIGGGHHPGKACIDLLVGGKIVRTATGPNKKPGGTERLDPASWDVKDLAGKKAIIRIVDEAKGGWGHINIDHIVFTDREPETLLVDAKYTITATKRYLHLPVKHGAAKRRMTLLVDGHPWREFDIELAEGEPGFSVFVDLQSIKGKKLTIQVDRLLSRSGVLKSLRQADEIPDAGILYKEKHRPQFHFTSRRGWLNDPNGLVYSKGEYHLFYQHNPYGWDWGNMHWGHAVSKDLVHWQELPIALYPKRYDDWAFSGSALVDRANTSGLKKGDGDLLIAAFTSTGRGECIAYSNDRGRTWTDLPENPVVKHSGRDPKVIWHAPSKRWVMAVYDEHAGKRWIAFHTSADLKKWQFASRIEGFYECPDLFEAAIDGQKENTKWVLYAADGQYILGDFDGKTFKKESGKHVLWHGNFYAAQTFSDVPDGRRIQIGWGVGITFPGMPFNQQMTVPCELTLRTTTEGPRLFAFPVKELDSLHERKHSFAELTLKPKDNPLVKISGELFDIRATFAVGKAKAFGFTIRGTEVVYDVEKQTLSCKGRTAPLKPVKGKIRLRLLVDRGSIEIFGNDGAMAMSIGLIPPDKDRSLSAFSRGGNTSVPALEVIELRSAWGRKKN
jgi:fructan beta-fructosidase